MFFILYGPRRNRINSIASTDDLIHGFICCFRIITQKMSFGSAKSSPVRNKPNADEEKNLEIYDSSTTKSQNSPHTQGALTTKILVVKEAKHLTIKRRSFTQTGHTHTLGRSILISCNIGLKNCIKDIILIFGA